MSQTIKGLLLIAHGSRNPEANDTLEKRTFLSVRYHRYPWWSHFY